MSLFPRLDILPSAQRNLWPELATVSRHSFVLYGGTAVALYLGHRESVDFDFFTNRPFQPDELFADYSFLADSEVFQSQPNTLTILTAGRDTDRVKISFFGGLRFGRLGPPLRTPDGVMNVASLADLLAHRSMRSSITSPGLTSAPQEHRAALHPEYSTEGRCLL